MSLTVEKVRRTDARPGRGVGDVLREGGFTRFHRKAVLVTGAAWTFVAMEILLVGFTVPLFTNLWSLSGSYAGWIAASALGGSLLGSLVLGPVADRVGRRRIFQAAILWYAVFTALTALAWGPGSLSAFRFLAGIGLGGMLVVDPAMLAEYLPPQKRGRFLVVLDLFWPVGLLLGRGCPGLPRAGRRRRCLALALPGRFVPAFSRSSPASRSGEPVLPGADGPPVGGGRGTRGDHRPACRLRRARGGA